MKKKIFIIFLLFLLSFLFLNYFFVSAKETEKSMNPPTPPVTEPFLIGAMSSYDPPKLPSYDLAGGLNVAHRYIYGEDYYYTNTHRYTPRAYITNEHLMDNVPVSDIHSALQDINSHGQSRFFWQRPKIEWLAYGQSSTYQAVQEDPDYWFYAYNDIRGEQIPDNTWNGGKWVLHCSRPANGPNAQIVLGRLKANTEQSNRIVNSGNQNDDMYKGQWQGDSQCDWYVKPRIRIDPYIAANFPETEVCKIHIKMEDGVNDKIAPVVIKAKHFRRNISNPYNGQYLEEFYFQENQNPTPITFTGDLGHLFWYSARGTRAVDDTFPNHSRADIKVEWLDNCEMWIDYVKVENDVADKLLKGQNDDWIYNEVNAVMTAGTPEPAVFNFYIELFEFNHIPCMAYVNQKIHQYSGGAIGLMADQLTYYQVHIPWGDRGTMDSPEKLKRMFFDKTGFHQIFLGDPYPIVANKPRNCGGNLNNQFSEIPSTFNLTPTDNDLFKIVPPSTYDPWLQGLMDTVCIIYEGGAFPAGVASPGTLGVFQYLMKKGNGVSTLCDKPFIAMLQAHQWMSSTEIDREPTNEELNVMVNEAVSYGAKGIIFYQFPSFHDVNNQTCSYSLGLIGENYEPRQTNVYGEPKWNEFKNIITRLKSWEPYVMSFSNTQTNSYIYRFENERNTLLNPNNSYFADVVSYEHGSGTPNCFADNPDTLHDAPAGWRYECNEHRYLQVATFNTVPSSREQYFMIVNKRCSPLQPITHDDGERLIKVRFRQNSNFLQTFNTWIITDLETDVQVGQFDKTEYYHLVDLGTFNPGEGKLYKIVPV